MISNRLLEHVCCPVCKSHLVPEGNGLDCPRCGRNYRVRNGIPVLVDLDKLNAHLRGQVEYFEKEVRASREYNLDEWERSYVGRFLEVFQPSSGKVLVDCGTGSGYMSIELAKLGCRCLACDLTLAGLLGLKYETQRLGLEDRVLLVCCNAEELPFVDNTADYLVASAILEHLEREEAAIEEMDRICKGDSGLMVTVPLKNRYCNPLFVPVNYVHDRRIGHLRRYDGTDLANLFNQWNPIRTYYTGHFKKVVKVLANRAHPVFPKDKIEVDDSLKTSIRWGASNITCAFRR